MRTENVRLGVEIVLFGLFYGTLLLAFPIVALVFTLVAEQTTLVKIPFSPLEHFGLEMYLVSFAVFSIPILTLLGVGWALRRWVANLED